MLFIKIKLGVKMEKILVIDNYDSFTYNLVHYLEGLNCEVTVIRNDAVTINEAEQYGKIILSPGPGLPTESKILNQIIKKFGHCKSILGVCLGHQAIAEAFGGSLLNPEKIYHGVASKINITCDNEFLFRGMDKQIEVGRYHSWVVNPDTLPEVLEVTSVSEDGQIMSLRHKIFNVKGIQFHPESILTPEGKKILENWING